MFHLSDIRNYLRCPRYFYLQNKELQLPRIFSNLRSDIPVEEIIKKRFNLTKLFLGKANDKPELFLAALEEYSWFFNARVENKNLRMRLPLLHKLNDWDLDVYYLILLPNPMAGEVINYAQTIKALQDLGFSIKNVYLLHLNPDYIRKERIDYHQLLLISKHFYNENHIPKERVNWWINKRIVDYSSTLEAMSLCLEGELPPLKDAKHCQKRPKCPLFGYCYPQYQTLESSEITSQSEYAQIMADKGPGIFCDQLALKYWLKDNFSYPLAFLDFEWDTFAVPPYKKMKPLDVLPFQYSLDVLQENGKITHYDFLQTGDTRLAFLRSLLKNLPKTGKIVVFNAEGGEKLRLLDLKRQFPHYGKKIDKLIRRIVDISAPFNQGCIYLSAMKHSYSLKSIVHAINQSDYKEMEVKDGREAFIQWRVYEKNHDPQVYEALINYCRKDTMSLITIFRYLEKIAKEILP